MTAHDAPTTKRLIRLPEVRRTVALSRSEIYRLVALKRFPPPIPLTGGRAVAWDVDEIQEWVRSRIAARS
jgi:prophage regulatory protein